MGKQLSYTFEEYLSQPKRARVRFGLYVVPFALDFEGWDKWDEYVKKTYPVQYWVRETWTWFSYRWKDLRRWPRQTWRWLFKPPHPLVRASIPRHWMDLSGLIEDINFAIIKQFELEMRDSCVDWDSDWSHRNFKNWILDAVDYIDNRRPALEQAMQDTYPKGLSFSQMMADPSWGEKYRMYEELIRHKDTDLLQQMVENRGFFWT